MRLMTLGAAWLLAISGGAALAADATSVQPAGGFNWTGGYVGVQAGHLWGTGRTTAETGWASEPDVDGWLGGVYVGYNHQLANQVVIGVEADLTVSKADGFGDAYVWGVPFPPPAIGDVYELNWSGAGRVKVGYAMDRLLPYVAGGIAFADVNVHAVDDGYPISPIVGDTMVGWTLGAGVEYAFTDNLIGRMEYRYTDFGDFDLSPIATAELKTHDVRFGLAYKF
ncbi:porin family protein [Aminobacter aminovorans]|uniref:outer membrane protein n=1 Tax=Aminobacter aminovorans TaxID=83263 RepID=UPI0028581DAF|nr:porin family protein [Aminobacter aminovorans]MDR7223920.1 outer membrane immunogenic protein [Aminobacter aminovorans]